MLLAAAKAHYPRWHPFLLTSVLGGLRWGECAALFTSDIDFKRGYLHVQRTVSGDGSLQPPKDRDGRRVKLSPALAKALKAHLETMSLEASLHDWTPETRRLVFPTPKGRVAQHAYFLTTVWKPLLKAAKLPYRKYHSTRHTYATWLLSDGADIRWVSKQMGHASISQTVDVYGHCQPEKHEAAVVGLDKYVNA